MKTAAQSLPTPDDVLKPSTAIHAAAGKYLTFHLGQEVYGVPVLKIREIIRLVAIMPVPQMPAYIKGVINLRGKVIPIVDLCVKLGLGSRDGSERMCIIVVQVQSVAGTEIQFGLLVDAVEEVAQIGESEIEETPEFGSQASTDSIL